MAASNLGTWLTWEQYKAQHSTLGTLSVLGNILQGQTPDDPSTPYDVAQGALEEARKRGMPRALVNYYTTEILRAQRVDDVDSLEGTYIEIASWSPDGVPPAGSPRANADQGFGESVGKEGVAAAKNAAGAGSDALRPFIKAIWDSIPTGWKIAGGVIVVGAVFAVTVPPLLRVAVSVRELRK